MPIYVLLNALLQTTNLKKYDLQLISTYLFNPLGAE